MRYYYKRKDGKGFLNLKSKLNSSDYIEITKEEFNQLTQIESPVLTAEELHTKEIFEQIASIKSELSKTDYQALKYAEGWISEDDYAEIKAARQALRDQINELEAQL